MLSLCAQTFVLLNLASRMLSPFRAWLRNPRSASSNELLENSETVCGQKPVGKGMLQTVTLSQVEVSNLSHVSDLVGNLPAPPPARRTGRSPVSSCVTPNSAAAELSLVVLKTMLCRSCQLTRNHPTGRKLQINYSGGKCPSLEWYNGSDGTSWPPDRSLTI